MAFLRAECARCICVLMVAWGDMRHAEISCQVQVITSGLGGDRDVTVPAIQALVAVLYLLYLS